jgi:hypothetical protein
MTGFSASHCSFGYIFRLAFISVRLIGAELSLSSNILFDADEAGPPFEPGKST